MHIRFLRFTPAGNMQFQAGEVLNLPIDLAQLHIDAGDAIRMPEAEVAIMTRPAEVGVIPRYRPQTKPPVKGRR